MAHGVVLNRRRLDTVPGRETDMPRNYFLRFASPRVNPFSIPVFHFNQGLKSSEKELPTQRLSHREVVHVRLIESELEGCALA